MVKFSGVFASIALVGLSAPAVAGTVVLTNGGSNSQVSKTFSNGELSVKTTAFSINTNNVIKTSTLASWGDGLGVINPGSDNSHTIDNSGWTDFVVFQFDKSVSLTTATFTTGWNGMNDTDATIGHAAVNWAAFALPWNADLTGVFNNQNKSFLNQFTLQGSNSIGNGSQTRNINPGLMTGNVWIVSAALINPDSYKDGFKIKRIGYNIPTSTVPGVPEPATWAMLILGMGVVGASMRRRSRAAIAFA